MEQVLQLCLTIARSWSLDRANVPNKSKPFYKIAPISQNLWVEASNYAQENVTTHMRDEIYYFHLVKNSHIILTNIDKFVKLVEHLKAKTFSDFQEQVQNVGRVHLQQDDWRTKSFCRCRCFQKEYVCKHVIGLAIRLGLVHCPETAINLAFERKKPRGAPRKARGGEALLKE